MGWALLIIGMITMSVTIFWFWNDRYKNPNASKIYWTGIALSMACFLTATLV